MPTPPARHWITPGIIPPEIDRALQPLEPTLRQILYNRQIETYETALDFLNAHEPPGCQPENLTDVSEAVQRILFAVKHAEQIAVYGDYDADGVTATALLTDVLRRLNAQVQGYIPNRFDEGYGLNNEAIDLLADRGVQLVITVDCGVRSLAEVEYASQLGIDVIITDHHQPGAHLPKAAAVIDPKRHDDSYPDKNLAGVGLAYKLASALLEKAGFKSPNESYPSPAIDYLDLVALGTVADQVPLINENRSLVRTGLEYLRRPHRQGVLSLIGAAQINLETITADSISFGLAPRLNAAGRLESALTALELLLTRDVHEAARLAQYLDIQNRERQEITRAIQAHVEETIISEDPEQLLLFAVNESYSPGVIGLAAAKLTEKYYRPAVVASQGEEYTRGSCRSIPEFHITNALDQCADLLVRHGGHAAAAGFTIENKKIPELAARLREIAQDTIGNLDLKPRISADMEIELSRLTPDLMRLLKSLEPTGSGNPSAVFVSRNVRLVRSRPVGKTGSHLKLAVTDGRIVYDAIAFQQGHWQNNLPQYIDICYAFESNTYNGMTTLQLNIKDIQPTSGRTHT